MSVSDNQNQGMLRHSKNRHAFLRRLKSPRLYALLTSVILIFSFQNCRQFDATTHAGSVSGSGTAMGTGTGSTLGTDTAAGTDAAALAAEAQRKRIADCVTLLAKPQMNGLSATQVTVLSGLATGAGDARSENITVTLASKGITNPARAQELLCPVTTSLRVQQLNGDTTYVHSVLTAIDLAGNEMVPTDPAAYKTALNSLIQNSVASSGNNQVFDLNSNTQNISFQPVRRNAFLRCVEGVAWYRVSVRTEITGDGGKAFDSDPQVVKVILKNNCWAESRLIPPNDLPRLVQYGAQGAIVGNLAAVLAPKEASATGVLEVGAVYVFEKLNGVWNSTARFQVQDAFARDTLNSIAISNGKIIVGSKYRGGEGAVFVYTKSGTSWNLHQKITAQSSQGGQEFGQALAASGNLLFVGAPNYSNRGVVYVYEFLNGNYLWKQTISPNAAKDFMGFGMALSVDGSALAVGAPQALLHESERAGEVQVFNLSGTSWVHAKTLAPAGTVKVGMKFGASVDILAGKIIVGAPSYAGGDTDINRGAAFYFENSAATPVALTGEAGDQLYGHAVAITGSGILVGAPYRNSRAGQVYYYATAAIAGKKASRIHYSQALTAQDNFGSFIDVSGSDVLMGARSKSSPNTGAGAAYIYLMK